MKMLRKIGRLFVIKTPLEAYLVTYAIAVGAIGLLILNVALWAICYSLLKSGWKIKN